MFNEQYGSLCQHLFILSVLSSLWKKHQHNQYDQNIRFPFYRRK
jgi:hypothetical protein